MDILKNILRCWLPLAVVITLLSGLLYVTVQQVLRMNANEPQIQMVEEMMAALAVGASPESVVPATQVDIQQSSAPFVTVFDTAGRVLATSGVFHGQPPALPPGVLEYARQHGINKVTWQPEPGVRIATVVYLAGFVPGGPGYVMAGRSLRDAESRTRQLQGLIELGGIATLVAAFVAIALVEVGWH